ncbi:MAG: monovalent cation/H+ antiporter subunit D family protein [Deltaproteobacteria bacterium]|nr:monovalent cation/H+ antiporter subunit D family protein [Deltaproteobacteria bacterium]
METVVSIKPVLAIAVSFCGVFLIIAFRKSPNRRESWTFIVALIKFSIICSILPPLLNGQQLAYSLMEVLPGVQIAFKVDPLGILFALVASSLWILTSLFSIGYMRSLKEHSQSRYYAFFALALFSATGVAFAANLFTLYLFYEMLSLSTYPLVTHHQDADARFGGRKYLVYLLGTSIAFFLPAIILTYTYSETLTFSSQGILAGKASDFALTVIFFLFLLGIGKAAIIPIHSWLPSAMVAPTPVSALLHAVAVVKAGVFSVLRIIFDVYGIPLMSTLRLGLITLYVVSFTILVASIFALSQDNLKARLAYSTIAQLSYIILGAALLSPDGMIGGVIHIVMHGFGKITLFFCAGAILVATGKKNISEMQGLGRQMPVTMFAFFVGTLSIIGLPPLGGFISKWNLLLGTLEARQVPILIVLLTSSLLNAAYFLPVSYQAFFARRTPDEAAIENRKTAEAPLLTVLPPVLTAAVSVGLFFYPDLFILLAAMAIGK